MTYITHQSLKVCKILLILSVSFIISLKDAKSSELKNNEINHFDVDNGLAGLSANKIVPDFNGRIWIATSGGVNMFDGIQLETVLFDGDEGFRPFVTDICVSPSTKNVYASTYNSIYSLSAGTSRFVPLMNMANGQLLCDGKRLYICNQQGFHVYENGNMRTVETKGDRNVHCMTFNPKDSTIWMLTTDALCHYFPKEGRIERKVLRDLFPAGINFGSLAIVDDVFYVGTKNFGLFAYNPEKRRIRHLDSVGNVITKISSDGRGNVCVATDGSGAFLVNGATSEVIKTYNNSADSEVKLFTNAVYHYYRDQCGNDFIALSRHGLVYTYHTTFLLNTYSYADFTTKGLNVRSFLIDGKKRLVGTFSGLYYIDESKGVVRHYPPARLKGGSIVTCIERLGDNYYIGTYDGGMNVLDAGTLEVKPFGDFNRLTSDASVLTLKKSPDGELWVGLDNGVAVITSDGNIRIVNSSNSGMKDGGVTNIQFTANGNVWVCTSTGLSVISANDGLSQTSTVIPDKFFQPRYYCSASTSNRENRLYFGSNEGVYYTNPAMTSYGKIDGCDKIVGESCLALCLDKDEKLWMASTKGVFRCDTGGTAIQNFGYGEGLSSMLIGGNGVFYSNDTVWIATSKGLQYICVDEIHKWEQDKTSKTLMYDVFAGEHNVKVSFGSNSGMSGNISLTWNFVSQKLRFKAMLNDFANPNRRIFEYRIDGERQWNLFWHGEEICISNLLLGEHSLCIRQAGRPGTETTYKVFVRPSFLAYIEFITLVLGIVLCIAWYRYYKKNHIMLRERYEIEEALVEVEKQTEALIDRQINLNGLTEPDRQPLKYNQIKLSEEECNDIVKRMGAYLETKRAYCNPELKRDDIARELQVTTTKLSYIFSMHLKMGFYEFINRYRLEEFKRLVAEGACSKYTITALSEKCGFKKSSFFSTFHRVEGMTPTEYLKSKNKKIKL